MKYALSVVCAILVLWGASVVLGTHPSWRVNDEATGFQRPVCGSSVMRFTEGGSVTRYGKLGLNPAVATLDNSKKPFFLLHGDSYIEALQVSDEQKPDAAMTRTFAGQAVVCGVGGSGFGFYSMIVRAIEYERVMGNPIAHIFFCTSVRSDILEDGGVEFAKLPEGLARRRAWLSSQRQAINMLVNWLHLNFVVDLQKQIERKVNDFLHHTNASLMRAAKEHAIPRRELEYVVNAMSSQLHSPSVIVYCPNLPRIEKGVIRRNNIDQTNADLMKECAEKRGIYFIDATSVLLGLYDRQGKIARGFANNSGPGIGHLNEDGINAVFGYVAHQLKERYGL